MTDVPFRRILFCNPPSGLYRRDDRCQCTVEDQTVQIVFPPIEMAVLAAMARRAGAEPRIADYPAVGGDWESLAADLDAFKPDAVVFFCTTATIEADLQVCRAVKERAGANALTIAKGEVFEAMGEELMARWPELDLALFGESEMAIESLAQGKPFGEIDGLFFRDGGKVVRTPKPPLIRDLDSLPAPARDLLRNEIYHSPETGKPLTVIHGNRGCPAKCVFCPAGPVSNYTLRLRSPGSVLDEIESCVNDFGIREFLFHGDTFTINKRWLKEICDGIVDRKLKIRWGCNSRVDTIDDERAAFMRKAGCWVVAFGVESGVQELLDKMKKGAKVERAREAIAICKRNGLRTLAFFVIGLPWETEDTLEQTYRFAREIDSDFFDFNIAYPLPGTELYDIAVAEGLVHADELRDKGYAHAAMPTLSGIQPETLNRWRRRALLKMYLRPNYIARMIWRARSPRVGFHYAKAAIRRFGQLIR
jgi:anaerobic magnesium-protoporphyrin IX monomethyl ester cyclase